MTTETKAKIAAEVMKMIAEGLDPRSYRKGMADYLKVAVEDWDAVTEELAAPRCTNGTGIASRDAHTDYCEGQGRREDDTRMQAFDAAERTA